MKYFTLLFSYYPRKPGVYFIAGAQLSLNAEIFNNA